MEFCRGGEFGAAAGAAGRSRVVGKEFGKWGKWLWLVNELLEDCLSVGLHAGGEVGGPLEKRLVGVGCDMTVNVRWKEMKD